MIAQIFIAYPFRYQKMNVDGGLFLQPANIQNTQKMSGPFLILSIVLMVIYLFKYIDRLFSPKKVTHNTSISISNDKETRASLISHYYSVLKMDPGTRISVDVIDRYYFNALLMLNDSNPLDPVIHEKREEIEAARLYLLDYVGYMGHRS
jgi:hypothetical protein